MRGQRSITPVRNSPLRTEMAKEFSVAWTFLNSDSAFMAKGSNQLVPESGEAVRQGPALPEFNPQASHQTPDIVRSVTEAAATVLRLTAPDPQ